ncbi:uncharacterized protein N7459_002581 [Penicillium hispanicum]|uniref:uncharacterized protein n=1 Tax=Penicillium hispanicum TaxID=1080232 RepID=UPI00253FBB7C|nr:uncharacterized protein N7459_002581 [Penicillium hispanicum]KAJ5586816.1 hypothetical protein N7459_002581 [Penicillium hispanicum]
MAPKQESPATVAVNISELQDSKDAVLMRLMALQSYIADLSKAYLEHSNNVINGGPATINIPALPTAITDLTVADQTAPKPEADGKPKRKRQPADPNAPKRPLTPYFLFMQNNRHLIQEELGDVKPKEVADEGTNRWQSMDDNEKQVWKDLYNENYEKYKVDVANYKTTRKAGEDQDQDPAASQLQQDFAGAENAAESSGEESAESESEEEEEESPSPVQPPKEKTPPRSSAKRRRSEGKAAKAVAETPAKQTSPQKKSKTTKNAEPASAAKADPKEKAESKRKGKKRKSEA